MPRLSPLRTWLQLFRAPNLFTVPGDPLAGYLLACYGAVEPTLWPAIGASLCFYAAGLLLNDLADLREDTRERPNRPLPSGAASPRAVFAVFGLLALVALVLCWRIDRATFATGALLLLAIVAYNGFTKRLPVIGALNMGACRGLSMLLGATAAPHGDLLYRLLVERRLDHLAVAVVLMVAYIAAVTNLARFETKVRVPSLAKWLPLVPLVAGALLFLAYVSPVAYAQKLYLFGDGPDAFSVIISVRRISAGLFLLAIANVLQTTLRLVREPAAPVPPNIGQLIRTLLIIQAALCAAAGGVEGSLATAALLTLWPLSRIVGRWFYAS